MPTPRQGYVWSGSEWTPLGPTVNIAPTYVQSSAPSSPTTGEIWVDTSLAIPTIDSATLVTTDTTQDITSPKNISAIRSGTSNNYRRLATYSNFGYSDSYKSIVLGSPSSTYNINDGAVTPSFNYDPSGNTGGSFTGNGTEVMFRNATKFITPNSSNTDFIYPMTFTSSGAVNLPNQPSFHAKVTSNAGVNAYQDIVYATVAYNTGSNYSSVNGRFTAPVSGLYNFYGMIRLEVNAQYWHSYLKVNGNFIYNGGVYGLIGLISTYNSTGFNAGVFSVNIKLSSGDYVTSAPLWTATVHEQSYFGGCLLG